MRNLASTLRRHSRPFQKQLLAVGKLNVALSESTGFDLRNSDDCLSGFGSQSAELEADLALLPLGDAAEMDLSELAGTGQLVGSQMALDAYDYQQNAAVSETMCLREEVSRYFWSK